MEFELIRFEMKKIHENAKMPYRKRTTDAGYDVAAIDNITIKPGKVANIRTGLIVTPPPGWYLTIDGRSSLFKEGITPFRGIIDATYTGELLVALYNSSKEDFKIEAGDRIAQFTIHKIYNAQFVEVEEFSKEYKLRGNNGWGSSGRN